MQPSSLIFLLVIAVWAAFLVQHWMGRRENLATARTVDRFSESMRILDRGTAAPDQADASARPAVSAARVHRRPETVSRAESLLASMTESSTVGRARVADAGQRAKMAGNAAAARARRVRGSAAPGGQMPVMGRATRGVLVIGSLTVALLASALAALQVIGWRIPVLALAVTGLAIWWLRRAVAAQRRVARPRSATRGPRQAPGAPTQSTPTRAVRGRAEHSRTAPTRQSARVPRAAQPRSHAPAGGATQVPEPSPAAVPTADRDSMHETGEPAYAPVRGTLYDLAAIEAVERQAVAEAAAAEGWSPVPVPPPTYTLKAKAVYASGPEVFEDEDDDVASPFGQGGDGDTDTRGWLAAAGRG